MDIFYFIIQNTMFFMIPLMIVALGGLFSEKSGIINIALEGKMVIGAFTGILTITTIQQNFPNFNPALLLLIAMLVAILSGVIISLLHAFASINLNANQVISGIAINMFAPAFAIYFSWIIIGNQNISFINQFRIDHVPFLGSIPLIGPMFFQGTYFSTLLGFIILGVSSFVLYKTKFGLRLRACGEHTGAADSVGISVKKIRYAGVILSGMLAGLGGLIYIIPVSVVFNGSVSGYGFLALAVLIFGGWNPIKIIFAAFFFGLMQTIAASNSAIPFLAALPVPSHFYRMAPYIATLILLAFTSKKTVAPKALGEPYDKGRR